MSKQSKFYWLLCSVLMISLSSASQNLLELTTAGVTASPTGNGFGSRITNHVITFDRDDNNNGNFKSQGANPNPIKTPYITAQFSFQNQQFTGLTYGAGTTNGAGTSNAVTSGLVFGAGPSQATGSAPGTPDGIQASPLNSYEVLGAFGNDYGAKNGMFMSDPTATPVASVYPAQSGSGIDVESNGSVSMFTCAQVLYDQGAVHNATTRHYFGDLVITFNRFVTNPVIHFAGLGGSYRYAPMGSDPNNTATWLSSYFTTELELTGPLSMTKMSGNQFISLSGNFITNNNTTNPNGESVDRGTPPAGQFNNFGAATGSIRINGTTNVLRFKVYLRGASGSQFAWSAPGSAIQGASRDPFTGDVWMVSVSLKREELIPLPVTGMRLAAALNNKDVKLNWKTYSEADTKEFEIERSTDGINFSKIATKAAAGSSYNQTDYGYTDPDMRVEMYYYRLKLIEHSGSFTYSNIVMVRKPAGNGKSIRIFPNPVHEQLAIEFSNAKGNYIISLYNQAGQEVLLQKVTVDYSVQYVPVSKTHLNTGIYMMRIINTVTGEKTYHKVLYE